MQVRYIRPLFAIHPNRGKLANTLMWYFLRFIDIIVGNVIDVYCMSGQTFCKADSRKCFFHLLITNIAEFTI